MTRIPRLLIAALFVFSSSAFGSDHKEHAHQHEHHHGSEHTALDQIQPKNKFESDAPLRSHMKEIRGSLQGQMDKIHEGKLKPKAYKELSAKIDGSIKNIFRDCKLERDADEALHVILSVMMAGSSEMKTGKTSEARGKGFLKVAKAFEKYGEVFKDSDWKPLKI